jgi:hypothetical protein
MGYSPFINKQRILTKTIKPANSNTTAILVPQPCVHCAGNVSHGGSQMFANIWEPSPNSTLHGGDKKQLSYWGLKIVDWPVNFSVIWGLLFGTCELRHNFLWNRRKEKERKKNVIMMQILGAHVQNTVDWETRCPGFVRSYFDWDKEIDPHFG